MPWIPGTPLTSPALDANAFEESSMKLWNEFLSGYFDGTDHVLGGVTIGFPAATIVHQRTEHEKQGLFIHITAIRPGGLRTIPTHDDDAVKQAQTNVTWVFWIKALAKDRQDGHNSESLCRWASDRLFALLSAPGATAPLNRKGIMSICCKIPSLVASPDWTVRSAEVNSICRFTLG